VDFKTHQVIHDIEYPTLAAVPPGTGGSSAAHGLAVTSDQRTLVACSRQNNSLYSYSLPDMKLSGTATLTGNGCAWVTVTPDGRKAYVADSVGNQTLVVDIPSMKEIKKIAVGQGPKRNHTMVIPAGRATNQN
jgi:YVTN family beta-propeller protein